MSPARLAFVAALLIPLAGRLAATSPVVRLGDLLSWSVSGPDLELRAANAVVRVTACAPEIVRVRVMRDAEGDGFSCAVARAPLGAPLRVVDEGGRLRAQAGELRLEIGKAPLRLAVRNRRGQLLNEDEELGVLWIGTEVTCHKRLLSGERFIGLGEKTGGLDRRGRAYVNWNTDAYGYGPSTDPLYCSIPFYIGLHDGVAYGIFLDNPHRTTFNFGASNDRFACFTAEDGELDYYVIGGDTVARVIENYTGLTGRMELPPLWALGYQQCRWSYFPDRAVLDLARGFRSRRIPADVIYLDIHWMDGYRVFTWHPERFPDPAAMVSELRRLGFHVAAIVDPGVKAEPGYPVYDQGLAGGHFVTYPDGRPWAAEVWAGRSHFPDFTRPATRAWWGGLLAALTGAGVEGFWNDMNEPATWGQCTPNPLQFDCDGHPSTHRRAHNLYGLQMARAAREGGERLLGRRSLVVTRAGYAGVQRYAAVWTGDNLASDEHMLLGVRLVNSLGLAGVPFCGPDIGGFAGEPTPALMTRWTSLGAYTPFFRNHAQYGSRPREPWAFGDDHETAHREAIGQRYRLLPYIYSVFREASRTGLPVARTLAIDYSFDERVYDPRYENEYLFGPHLLVAPAGSEQRLADVFLPPGTWYRLSSDRAYSGNRNVLVEAPLSDLPVFARAGAIVPMQPLVQHTGQKPEGPLELHVWAGPEPTSFTLYEDDGTSFAYREGGFRERLVSWLPGQKRIVLGAVSGSHPSAFDAIRLVLHGFAPGSARVNGRRQPLEKLESGQRGLLLGNPAEAVEVTW